MAHYRDRINLVQKYIAISALFEDPFHPILFVPSSDHLTIGQLEKATSFLRGLPFLFQLDEAHNEGKKEFKRGA